MNLRFPHFLICALAAALACISTTKAFAEGSPVTATYLRCEYLLDPLGIGETKPRLSWLLTAPAGAPRNLNQVSYHILVASSPEILARDQGDLWDSGEVRSRETTGVVYGGTALQSREDCFWKVRVTDSRVGMSEWSQTASWEMGLLKPEDWQAKWLDAPAIALTGTSHGILSILAASYEAKDGAGAKDVTGIVAKLVKDNSLSVQVGNDALGGDPAPLHVKQLRVSYAWNGKMQEVITAENKTLTVGGGNTSLSCLRKDFTLGKAIAKARLYATALGLYELHLNGQRVGDHLFAPDWTDYDKRVRYQAYDVTSLVKSGRQCHGRLWSATDGTAAISAMAASRRGGRCRRLFAQLEVTYTDGSVDRFVTDGSWKMHASPILSVRLHAGREL